MVGRHHRGERLPLRGGLLLVAADHLVRLPASWAPRRGQLADRKPGCLKLRHHGSTVDPVVPDLRTSTERRRRNWPVVLGWR